MNTTTTQIPRRVKAFGRLWAIKYMTNHPFWYRGDDYCDAWYAYGDYDLNFYCEDGELSVCAYPMTMGEDGFMVTDHSQFTYIVRKGQSR